MESEIFMSRFRRIITEQYYKNNSRFQTSALNTIQCIYPLYIWYLRFLLNLDFTCFSSTVTTEKANAYSPRTSCFTSHYVQTLRIGYIPKSFAVTSPHNIWNLLFTCKRNSWVFLNTKVLNLLHLGSVSLFAERF